MFGKDNTDKINELSVAHNKNVKAISEIIQRIEKLQELFSSLQESVFLMGKVEAQHRVIVSFLLNHVTVDPNAEADLTRMMQEVVKLEHELKEKVE